ncbi:MAG: DUF5658 family protein [Phycisphaerales bacterium]|nr:DUF5658 family protein [Phycisphaerales bacterium]
MDGEGTTASSVSARRSVAYGRLYFWYILLATLDLLTTVVILNMGGREVNTVANAVLQAAGPTGLLLLKYASVALVVCICEFIAARKPGLGRIVAVAAIALSAFPVAVGWAQLAAH